MAVNSWIGKTKYLQLILHLDITPEKNIFLHVFRHILKVFYKFCSSRT